MDPKLVAAVVLSCLCIVGFEAFKPTTFPWNGRTCEFREVKERHNLDRTLRVGCKGDPKKSIRQISCQYDGNPHPCKWYNQGNQQSYYACLVVKLERTGGNDICSPGTVSCHNHCEGIVFVKRNNIVRDLKAKIDEQDTYEQESYDQMNSSYDEN